MKKKTILISNELWEYVEEGFEDRESLEGLTNAQKAQLKVHKAKDARALSMIQQGVGDTIFPRIINATKSKEARHEIFFKVSLEAT